MLLVFDIPPSRSVQSPSVSDTHTHTQACSRAHTGTHARAHTNTDKMRNTQFGRQEYVSSSLPLFFPNFLVQC